MSDLLPDYEFGNVLGRIPVSEHATTACRILRAHDAALRLSLARETEAREAAERERDEARAIGASLSEEVQALHQSKAAALDDWRALRAERDALLARLHEDNAVCLCGCPLSEHEAVDEGAEQCEHEDHECLRVAPAVLEIVNRCRVALSDALKPAPPPDAASRDGSLTAQQIVDGTMDLFPGADRQAIRVAVGLALKAPADAATEAVPYWTYQVEWGDGYRPHAMLSRDEALAGAMREQDVRVGLKCGPLVRVVVPLPDGMAFPGDGRDGYTGRVEE